MRGGRQRREEYRRLVVARGLFVIVGIADELLPGEGSGAEEGEGGGSVPWVKPLGTVMAVKPVWGERTRELSLARPVVSRPCGGLL